MNTNNTYESISFEVEGDLPKPEKGYENNYVQTIPSIFSSLFTNNNNGIFENLEILHYEFNTKETEFFNTKKKSLIKGLIEAYKNHYPITVSPDMIWLLFLQGYSRFMEQYSELVRNQYVNFECKKNLYVKRIGYSPKETDKEIWRSIIDEFTEKIKENIGDEILPNLQSDFSTTDPVSLTTSQVSIMSSMKQYFNYCLGMAGCGISSITLEGSLEDWQKIKSKLEFFSKKIFALSWWTKYLIPIIDKIIMTKNYYTEKNDINQDIKDFWKNMIRVKFGRQYYDPNYIDGWIIKFIPDITSGQPKLYDQLKENNIPDQIISCHLKLIFLDLCGRKIEYNCSFESGFYGMIQDKNTFNVKPVIGYAIVVDEKKIVPMSNEERLLIIDQFFCYN